MGAKLRYFNPIDNVSGRIGEDHDVPNNLMPYVAQVALGKRSIANMAMIMRRATVPASATIFISLIAREHVTLLVV